MYTDISQFEPLLPAETGALEDLALKVHESSAKLAGRFPAATLDGIAELLRIVNSYYSNLIEGHNTHPIAIQRAMRRDYSADEDKRDLQLESLIHIEVQKKIIERLAAEPDINIASAEFLYWIHGEFYEQMPERLRWCYGAEGAHEWVEAGQPRKHMVQVGNHIPPVADSIGSFLRRFEKVYNPAVMHGLRPLIALAAAHHRLMWIHPFLDGNGRVARLFTDASKQPSQTKISDRTVSESGHREKPVGSERNSKDNSGSEKSASEKMIELEVSFSEPKLKPAPERETEKEASKNKDREKSYGNIMSR